MADVIQPDPLLDKPEILTIFKTFWKDAPHDRETGAWVQRHATMYRPIPWGIGTDRSATWKEGYTPHNLVAQIHNHPDTLDPKPSIKGDHAGEDGDWGIAKKYNIPVYVISTDGIWKVLPDKTEAKRIKVRGSGWAR